MKTGKAGLHCVAIISLFVTFWLPGQPVLANWTSPVNTVNDVCSGGTGIPPFLGVGIDPNLLIILDNSGSMYDLAYTETVGDCFDDTFDSTKTYSGYFESTFWYEYNQVSERFVETTAAAAIAPCNAVSADKKFSKASVVCITGPDGADAGDDMDSVAHFGATGNYLNWAAASKFDIEKKILTGGKYEDDPDNDTLTQDGRLVMESRGCMNRQFVKQLPLDQSVTNGSTTTNYYLTLGIRPPMEQEFDLWQATTVYAAGDRVKYKGIVYSANAAFTSGATFVAANWTEYKLSRWYPNVAYPADSIVYDLVSKKMYITRNGGTSLATATELSEDTAVDWILYNLTHIEIYTVTLGGFDYDACQLALTELNTLDDTNKNDSAKLGRLKSYTEDCMGYDSGSPHTEEGYKKSAFNHSMQECWYYNKFDQFQPGSGTVNSMKTSCEGLYGTIYPADLSPWDNAYVCSGEYGTYPPSGYVGRCWEPIGAGGGGGSFVDCATEGKVPGNFWGSNSDKYYRKCVADLGGVPVNTIWECTVFEKSGSNFVCNTGTWVQMTSGVASDVDGWTNDNFYVYDTNVYTYKDLNDCVVALDTAIPKGCNSATVVEGDHCVDPIDVECNWEEVTWTRDEDAGGIAGRDGWWTSDLAVVGGKDIGDYCVDQAIRDFCVSVEVPEVIDPSDSTGLTGTVWNAPAMLADGGVIGQLNKPIATMLGYIAQIDQPEGILHQVQNDLRIGVMTFNDNGAAKECTDRQLVADPNDPILLDCPADNRDGARIIAFIDSGSDHMDNVVQAINDIKAITWTPLAEAMYEAIGYYAQKSGVNALRLNDYDFLVESEIGVIAAWGNGNAYSEGDLVLNAGDRFMAMKDGTSSGTGPEDDVGVDWLAVPDSVDPVQYHCQDNHIMIITEGASTADINQKVVDFVSPSTSTFDDDQASDGACTDGLYGSTYLDDLTWWGQNAAASDLYAVAQLENSDKQNITTHLITTGSLRTDGVDECSPKTLMEEAAVNGGTIVYKGEDTSTLRENLLAAISDILSRASAGSAASVISSSRSGEGAVYQAVFWPRKIKSNPLLDPLLWAGDAHAFFIDENGYLREDTDGNGVMSFEDVNGNGILDDGEDIIENNELDGDLRVNLYFDEVLNKTRACMNDSKITTGTCNAIKDLEEIKYIWSANNWLSSLEDSETDANRPLQADGTWDFSSKRRYIFTWNDLNDDGLVDSNEVLDFEESIDWDALAASVSGGRGTVVNDFALSTGDDVKNLVSWIRGEDVLNDELVDSNGNGRIDTAMRDRSFSINGVDRTWRLGDIIHSSPTVVASPAEAYHFLYRDESYALFAKKYKKRRHVIYFGGNDGMMHAINGGFYVEEKKGFLVCSEEQRTNGNCNVGLDYAELGTELWAYVPYNLTPHLKCLSASDYTHKYFVDARPRIFDVQIFKDDCVYNANNSVDCSNARYPGGWGTILVGHMGFGGEPVEARDFNGVPGDTRRFQSSYFILDVTDPERPPELLGEMTRTTDFNELFTQGYTTPSPTMVMMRDTSVAGGYPEPSLGGASYAGATKWYLIMGNGPSSIKGENEYLSAKLGVLPLEWLKGALDPDTRNYVDPLEPLGKKAFRIPKTAPGINGGGTILTGIFPGFVSDLITIDYDVGKKANSSVDYRADAVYFGTVEGRRFEIDAVSGKKYWNGGGRMMRLVTKRFDANGNQRVSIPSEWYLRTLYNPGRPITAAASVGTDGDNFWVYFGTGRFLDPNDKQDATQQYYFGIKEPWDISNIGDNNYCSVRKLSWNTVSFNLTTGSLNPALSPGLRGLVRSDQIWVEEESSNSLGLAVLHCADGTTDCIPAGITPYTYQSIDYFLFDQLREYIAGEDCLAPVDNTIGVDGWYRRLPDLRERNMSQAALLGGLTTFTTYQPFEDVCKAEGVGFLYAVHFQTGTAAKENVFGTRDENGHIIVEERYELGKGLSATPNIHVGSGEGSDATAFVQTSTGEILEISQENLPIKSYKTGKASWSNRCEP